MTNAELVAVIGAVLDRPLRYEQVSNDVVRQRFTGAGLSPEFADAYIAMLSTTVDEPAPVTREVENILGRPAVPWQQWVSEHQNLFAK
jgi:truncated hemoglobin YjbI